LSQTLHRASLAKNHKLWYQPRRGRRYKGENVEKTGRASRRDVSFRLILQILPERYRASSDGKADYTTRGNKEKRSAENGNHDATRNELSLRRKSPSQCPPYTECPNEIVR